MSPEPQSIDRSGKAKIEQLAKLAPIPSPECRVGVHATCPGYRTVAVAGEVWRSENGKQWRADTIQAPCGCRCHRA